MMSHRYSPRCRPVSCKGHSDPYHSMVGSQADKQCTHCHHCTRPHHNRHKTIGLTQAACRHRTSDTELQSQRSTPHRYQSTQHRLSCRRSDSSREDTKSMMSHRYSLRCRPVSCKGHSDPYHSMAAYPEHNHGSSHRHCILPHRSRHRIPENLDVASCHCHTRCRRLQPSCTDPLDGCTSLCQTRSRNSELPSAPTNPILAAYRLQAHCQALPHNLVRPRKCHKLSCTTR